MKIMIASDIHGSAYYCRQLLEQYRKEKPDKLLLLGDILYHGPRNDLPREILCVRGNCDTEVDQMVLEFPILADYAILYTGTRMIYATHGHVYHMENPPMMKRGDILLHGHTHVPAKQEFDGKYYLNPGSVSIPKEESPHGYLMLEEGDFTWKTLEGKEYNYAGSKEFDI